MQCPICGVKMVISEWDGWKWVCFFCDHEDSIATDTEIEEYENNWFFNKFNNYDLFFNTAKIKKLRRL